VTELKRKLKHTHSYQQQLFAIFFDSLSLVMVLKAMKISHRLVSNFSVAGEAVGKVL
jgi:hypothetical protein